MKSTKYLTHALAAALIAGQNGGSYYGPLAATRPQNKRRSYDTNALRDDEQRIKDAQERRERKRAKRLAQRNNTTE